VCAACVQLQVAVGPRHAALLTRGGEVYTWGSGMGGNGGNGTAAGSNYPQQVRPSVWARLSTGVVLFMLAWLRHNGRAVLVAC
jgi:hypothetical protein